jgi:hypothetical protein
MIAQRRLALVAASAAMSPLVLRRATLSFGHSRDEEYVTLRLISDSQIVELGARKHNFLLLTLARRRLADKGDGFPDGECGWVYVDDLARDPTMAPPKLHLDVFRIRSHLSSRGVIDARGVVEHRVSAGQIRIGTGCIAIANL